MAEYPSLPQGACKYVPRCDCNSMYYENRKDCCQKRSSECVFEERKAPDWQGLCQNKTSDKAVALV